MGVRRRAFILTATQSYLYDRGEKGLTPIGGRFEGPYRTLDPLLDRMLKGFAAYIDQIAELEERLYANRPGQDFMTRWLELKRDIVRAERVMLHTADTLKEVVEHYADTAGFPIDHFADLHEHADRIARSATLQLAKLDYIYNFYNARMNERMNRIIYLLTVISVIFLPLNLVVGFFGMNTGGLPFSQESSGTVSAAALMASLLLLTSIGLYLWLRRDGRRAD